MSFFDYFRSTKEDNSAQTAKERLRIIVAHERNQRSGPDYLPAMKQDILDVIKKYVEIDSDQVNVSLDNKDEELSILELNITFPDKN
ncbi:cell division topological specificity factor MinE [Alginatibacterium sediminis]|uniref:Cell division topological specificity factor n=1 Tax=Alginatibacterium sediminis TaxID=2164068 RepID=A0A420EFX8_9ALTE|nr:cell division topological specificity factor MinE [Alginatibacterium sediminis]RKF19578.1 cell division topological specificity factor MinE [Alginatibacterium sediminis]